MLFLERGREIRQIYQVTESDDLWKGSACTPLKKQMFVKSGQNKLWAEESHQNLFIIYRLNSMSSSCLKKSQYVNIKMWRNDKLR